LVDIIDGDATDFRAVGTEHDADHAALLFDAAVAGRFHTDHDAGFFEAARHQPGALFKVFGRHERHRSEIAVRDVEQREVVVGQAVHAFRRDGFAAGHFELNALLRDQHAGLGQHLVFRHHRAERQQIAFAVHHLDHRGIHDLLGGLEFLEYFLAVQAFVLVELVLSAGTEAEGEK